MDGRLRAWARRVKAGGGAPAPPLWLFADAARLPDPLPAITRLPMGRAGVVFRPEGYADAARLGRAMARLCRTRRLALTVAGDPLLAARLGAGLHLRGGRRQPPGGLPAHAGPRRHGGRHAALATASAHGPGDIARARRAGARLIFLSPLFPTASHPGRTALGVPRWSAWARLAGRTAAALGGIDGRRVAALPRRCRAIGAIGALIP